MLLALAAQASSPDGRAAAQASSPEGPRGRASRGPHRPLRGRRCGPGVLRTHGAVSGRTGGQQDDRTVELAHSGERPTGCRC